MVDTHCYLFQHQSLQCQRLYTDTSQKQSLFLSWESACLLTDCCFFFLLPSTCLPPILLSPLPSLPVITSHRALCEPPYTFSMLGFLSETHEPGGRTLESSLKLTRYFFCTHMSGAHCSRPIWVLSSLRISLSNSSNLCLSVPTMSSKHLHLRNQLNITLEGWLIIAYYNSVQS